MSEKWYMQIIVRNFFKSPSDNENVIETNVLWEIFTAFHFVHKFNAVRSY